MKNVEELQEEIENLKQEIREGPSLNRIEVSLKGVEVESKDSLDEISQVIEKLIKKHEPFINDKRDISKLTFFNGVG